MGWNKHTAAVYIRQHATSSSQGRCAAFTRRAINAGGVNIGQTLHAKDYGRLLSNAGFTVIGTGEMLQEGDVVVIQPYPGGNESGHMAMYDGQNWYFDFRQRDMWGGPGYRSARPAYKIYRRR
ncbi:NlpC/P60 family protein [Chimaeribacter arupi]|uniref:NlpC/P60 domain-containing protein n=1 Tax=Chimaeribacter arupi TaxID=2060066 RepID=A0A2N5ELX7_9GAMM|nr:MULTISPECIES: NlpC/P60 family protein [Yersiniaceae]PLR34506.1 hypothetical protein CYR23_10125 [Chimaeribacter arupi]PLR48428.1 hypothetical protein CYR34_13120 [Chimaeribacter arupi]WKZ93922.1 NlpC/P60 family protein [Chimaeribacter arupi]